MPPSARYNVSECRNETWISGDVASRRQDKAPLILRQMVAIHVFEMTVPVEPIYLRLIMQSSLALNCFN